MTTGKCACPKDPAITGSACEKSADCNIFGCANGGFCGWNGKCICRPPFEGVLCDLVDSSKDNLLCSEDADCMNGTCNVATGLCGCENPNSYGPLCEHSYNCSQTNLFGVPTCLNSGTCNTTTGVCDCLDPFFGPDCSKAPRCLSDVDCGVWPWNTCDTGSGLCICDEGRTAGRFCEKEFAFCSDDVDCNGGACDTVGTRCECVLGKGGDFCDSFLAGVYDAILDISQHKQEESIQRCGFDDPWCCNSSGPFDDFCAF